MKDKHGHDYDALVAIQKEHLDLWHDKLKFPIICAVEAYCQTTNTEAGETGTHLVYRGQDLVQIILDWPDLKPCYAPINPNSEDLL